MKAKVTSQGVLLPEHLFNGAELVEIHEQDGSIILTPISDGDEAISIDPILNLGSNPIEMDEVGDASVNHDRYLTSQ